MNNLLKVRFILLATSLIDSRKAISSSMSFSEDGAASPEAAPAEDDDDDNDAE